MRCRKFTFMKEMKNMKKLIIGVMAMGIISMLTGCMGTETGAVNASKTTSEDPISEDPTSEDPIPEEPIIEDPISEDPITIDYADYPDDFMIRLLAGQKYILQNKDTAIEFCANSKSKAESDQVLEYGESSADISSAVYYGATEPVLIHYKDNDYVWICEQHQNNNMLHAYVYYVVQNEIHGSDNCGIDIYFDGNILDPNDFVMGETMECFGMVSSEIHYRVGETGVPERIETDDEYYSIEESYTKELLRLDNDIHTWVYEDADAKEYTVTDILAGTTFYRLRIPKDDEFVYAEGILEDGRVFRVIQEEKFDEPSSYMVMRDMDDHKFEYSVVTAAE